MIKDKCGTLLAKNLVPVWYKHHQTLYINFSNIFSITFSGGRAQF